MRTLLPTLCCALLLPALLAGCGDKSASGVQNAPPPPAAQMMQDQMKNGTGQGAATPGAPGAPGMPAQPPR